MYLKWFELIIATCNSFTVKCPDCWFNMKRKILPNCLKGKCEYHLGEISNLTFVVFWAERVEVGLKRVKFLHL